MVGARIKRGFDHQVENTPENSLSAHWTTSPRSYSYLPSLPDLRVPRGIQVNLRPPTTLPGFSLTSSKQKIYQQFPKLSSHFSDFKFVQHFLSVLFVPILENIDKKYDLVAFFSPSLIGLRSQVQLTFV